jgi:hypothetical protein
LNELSSEQLSEWHAYDQIEPMGNWIEDFRLARLSALIVNIVKSVWAKKGSYKWSSPEEFMPGWEEEPKQQSVDEMKQVSQNIVRYSKKGKRKDG